MWLCLDDFPLLTLQRLLCPDRTAASCRAAADSGLTSASAAAAAKAKSLEEQLAQLNQQVRELLGSVTAPLAKCCLWSGVVCVQRLST